MSEVGGVGVLGNISPNDFTVTFDAKGSKKTLHIPWEDLLEVPEILNAFLMNNNINSHVTDG